MADITMSWCTNGPFVVSITLDHRIENFAIIPHLYYFKLLHYLRYDHNVNALFRHVNFQKT